ncbi:MAG: transposase [Eubacteriales bacterium]|nr:transposase [Bacillota bacterium]MDQ7790092.1 transposase [Clostridia bacterium]MDZ4042660.1 transposase [Eubacteriales bacterium]MDZ7610078.1 transposase [Eubacteriales bacterium]
MTHGLIGSTHEQLYHVIMEGSRETVFNQDADYQVFLGFLTNTAELEGFVLLAYLLMPDHVHLVVRPQDIDRTMPTARRVEQWCSVLKSYAPALEFHRVQKILGVKRLRSLIHHLRLEPVKAGLAHVPGKYRWFGGSLGMDKPRSNTGFSSTIGTVTDKERPVDRKARGREARLNLLLKGVCKAMRVSSQEILNRRLNDRSREARRLFIYVAHYSLGYPVAVIGRFLGVGSAFIVRSLAHTKDSLEQDPQKAAAWQQLVSELYLATIRDEGPNA